jgi:hypothetical protein
MVIPNIFQEAHGLVVIWCKARHAHTNFIPWEALKSSFLPIWGFLPIGAFIWRAEPDQTQGLASPPSCRFRPPEGVKVVLGAARRST